MDIHIFVTIVMELVDIPMQCNDSVSNLQQKEHDAWIAYVCFMNNIISGYVWHIRNIIAYEPWKIERDRRVKSGNLQYP